MSILTNQVKRWFDCDDLDSYSHARITIMERSSVKCAARYRNKVRRMKVPVLEHDKRKNVVVMIWHKKGIESCCRKLHAGWLKGKHLSHFLPFPTYEYEEHAKNVPGINIVTGVCGRLKSMRGLKEPVLFIAKQRNSQAVCLASQWYIISGLWLWLKQPNIVSG